MTKIALAARTQNGSATPRGKAGVRMTETPGRYDVGNPSNQSQPSIQELDSKIDILIEQVARLTEVLTTGLNDFNDRLNRMAEATERQVFVVFRQVLTIERPSLMSERVALMLERVFPESK